MRSKYIQYFSLLLCSLCLTSCTSSGLYRPLPQKLENKVKLQGYHSIRAWGDSSSKAMEISAEQSITQILKANNGKMPKQLNALALSGGGADGAFGAGLLYGWTKTGKRPTFHLVSGISTGALIAPFAFLGSKYDEHLKKLYTQVSENQIYEFNNPLTVVFSYIRPMLKPAVASNEPMEKLMKQILDQEMLDEIGKEHLKGRRLFIGTTQFNAQRLVIWDIGAIAVSGNPQALHLVHKILLASSALPGIFPPQYFPVRAGGRNYKEMHMDGGVETQVMLYEKAISPFAQLYVNKERTITKRLYIVRNRKVDPEWENVKPKLHSMLGRAIFTLTKTQGVGDLYRLYAYAKRDHIDYNLAYIPSSFLLEAKSFFDTDYMKKLFSIGENLSSKHYSWSKHPPGLYD